MICRSGSFMTSHFALGLRYSMPDLWAKCAAHPKFFHGFFSPGPGPSLSISYNRALAYAP